MKKLFRVFISSTFLDLAAERQALQERVFPRIRVACEELGARFQPIDLRWGISQEAALDQRTMRICMGEIDHCRRVTRRPNFLILLGNRYGWRPLPEVIPADEFERFAAVMEIPADWGLLQDWYRRDDNAVPPAYVLRPRTDDQRDPSAWGALERRLRSILCRAAERAELPAQEMWAYSSSATEQEIARGLLSIPETCDHAFAFCRDIVGEPPSDHPAIARFLDVDAQGRPDRDARDRLVALLARRMGPRLKTYRASWTAQGISTDHLDALCRDVYDCLIGSIREEMSREATLDPLDQEIEAHANFITDKARNVSGRTPETQAILAYLRGPGGKPFVITGKEGIGKSAVMARASELARHAAGEAAIVNRFIGASEDSTDARRLLQSLCKQIGRCYGSDNVAVPADQDALARELDRLCNRASVERPLWLFLDGLDQLTDAQSERDLSWLPERLPHSVRMVISTRSGEWLSSLEGRYGVLDGLRLGPIDSVAARELLRRTLSERSRRLQPVQEAEILRKFERCGVTLYLKICLDDATRWASHDPAHVRGDDVRGLLHSLLARLGSEKEHGSVLVSRSLGFIGASRHGLSEEEMLDVLSMDPEVLRDVEARHGHANPRPRLPIAVWSRLYHDLQPFLITRKADETSVMSFCHQEVEEAVKECYLRGSSARKMHVVLADYFRDQPLRFGSGKARVSNLRKVSELPHHITRSGAFGKAASLLTDIDFMEAKATTRAETSGVRLVMRRTRWNGSMDLLDDYDALITAASEASAPETGDLSLAALTCLRESLAGELHHLRALPRAAAQQVYLALCDRPRDQAREEAIRRLRSQLNSRCYVHLAGGGKCPRSLRTYNEPSGMKEPFARILPSGRQAVLVAGDGKNWRLWDLSRERIVRTVSQGFNDSALASAVSQNGDMLGVLLSDGSCCVWTVEDGRLISQWEVQEDAKGKLGLREGEITFSADGRLLAALVAHGIELAVSVWSVPQGSLLARSVVAGPDFLMRRMSSFREGVAEFSLSDLRLSHQTRGVWFCPDTDALIAAGSPIIREWNWKSNEVEWSIEYPLVSARNPAHLSPSCVAVDPASGRMFTSRAAQDGLIPSPSRLWEIARHSPTPLADLEDGDDVTEAVFLPDGSLLVGLSAGNRIHMWRVSDGTVIGGGGILPYEPLGLSVSPDGECVLVSSNSHIFHYAMRDIRQHTKGGLAERQAQSAIFLGQSVVFAAHGTLVALGTPHGRHGWRRRISPTFVRAMTPARSAGLLLCGDDRGNCYVVTARDGEIVTTWESGLGVVRAICDAGDEGVAFVGTEEGHCVRWSWKQNRVSQYVPQLAAAVSALCPWPDGSLLAVAVEDPKNGCLVWDRLREEPRAVFEGHTACIQCLALHPAGTVLAAGSMDGTVRLWDIAAGVSVGTLGHEAGVVALAFQHEGQRLLTIDEEGTCRLWRVENAEMLTAFSLDERIVATDLDRRTIRLATAAGGLFELAINGKG